MDTRQIDAIVDRVWKGEAPMEEWTAAVSGGAIKEVSSDVVVVSTGYLFGNVTVIRTEAGLVMIDTGSRETAHETLRAVRNWDTRPIHTVIYTHGHIDHTWGARLLDKEADDNGIPRPRIIAHRNVLCRFQRYDETQGLNTIIMGRQFNQADYTFPGEHRRPDQIYDEELTLTIGGIQLQLRHGRGETDDATFVWLPEKKVLVSGDFVIWAFPNAGNPRKVQRFANDWADTLRQMHGLAPAVLVPGHGPVITDAQRTAQLLDDGASTLESLVRQTLNLMNGGHSLNTILHHVKPPAELLAKPYLLPKYDDPEFVVRNLWHLYAGWFDDNPAHLKPPSDYELGTEIANLAGGVVTLARRAETLCRQGQIRLAASLIEFAVAAAPDDKEVHRVRATVYTACVEVETSLIGKAIMAVTQRASANRAQN